jgi:hypothetical protein
MLKIETTDFATSRAFIYFFTATSAKCADQLSDEHSLKQNLLVLRYRNNFTILLIYDMIYDVFVDCNWVDIWWQ